VEINLEFIGFAGLYDLFKKRRGYTLAGGTIFDLVEDLVLKHGQTAARELLSRETGWLDPVIQVRINEAYLEEESLKVRRLEEGDRVVFLKLLAGG